MNHSAPVAWNLSNELSSSAAYQNTLAELQALPARAVKSVNVGISRTVTRVIGTLPGILKHRTEIAHQIPLFDLGHIDSLERLALTLIHANARCLTTVSPSITLKALIPEAIRLRNLLRIDIDALVTHELVAPSALRDYTGRTGYRNIASDLRLVSSVLSNNLERIQGRCAVKTSELERASTLAIQILELDAERGSTHRIGAPEDMVNRAFTLLVRSYDEVRRAVQYVRAPHGDADLIAPSLYARGRRMAKVTHACAATTGHEGVLN